MGKYAQVIIQFAKVAEIDKFFTYGIPNELLEVVQVGQRVKVPFGQGNNGQIGYIMGLSDEKPESKYPIKSIINIIEEEPVLGDEQMMLVKCLVEDYGVTYAMAIETILPAGLGAGPLIKKEKIETFYTLSSNLALVESFKIASSGSKSASRQLELLHFIEEKGRITAEQMRQEGLSMSSLTTLVKKAIVEKIEQVHSFVADPINEAAFKILTKEQEEAYHQIGNLLRSGASHTVLLEGVTGSGKTEVFLRVIKDTLESGKTAIVLVPEIALTPQTFSRFKERFGNRVVLTHSRMTSVQRQQLYMKVRSGEASVVIGPRSAIFMPLAHLGLIVVDEEHETSYKSETMPKYHATHVAKKRMAYHKGVALLASATPSIESYYEAKNEAHLIELKKRATGANLPEVHLIDMRIELKNGNNQVISHQLHEAIDETLKAGNQVMLLLNRRGHSTFINCRKCGYVVKCKHCDLAMTYHMHTGRLECHQCASVQQVPVTCPSCESKYIRFFGNGTEKVEEYLNTHFASYGIGRMDYDTTTGKEGHEKVLTAFKERAFNVLVGTQMIAKGHDFPNVALVGILAADMSLYIQDFRSEERTFQLLTQALGRAGRGNIPGKVMIQSYNVEHPVLLKVKTFNQKRFYEEELKAREHMGYPPYTHLFQVVISGTDEKEVIAQAHLITHYYTYYNKKKLFRIIGPASAVISKIADDYRWKLIIIGEDREKLLLFGKYCMEKFIKREKTAKIKLNWDIDPYTMI